MAVQRFAAKLASLGDAGVLMVDTLARCTQGSAENAPDGMGAALAGVDTLRETGWGVLLLAHPARERAENPRGHSSQDGAADCIWSLRDEDGKRLLACTKLKDGPEGVSFSLTLVSHENGVLLVPPDAASLTPSLAAAQRAILRTVCDTDSGSEVAAGVILDTSGVPKATVYRALKTLLDDRLLREQSHRYALTPGGLLSVSEP